MKLNLLEGVIEVSDLVKTLIIGFFTSIVLTFLVWWFWKRYDKPSDKQLEVQQERKEKSKEIRMWRAVESQMKKEEAAAEEQAIYQRRKAEERARGIAPPSGVISNAFAALESSTEGDAFNERFKPKEDIEQVEVQDLLEQIQDDDSDVLLAPDLVEVRQDEVVESQDLLLELQQQEDPENHEQEVIEVPPYEDEEQDDTEPVSQPADESQEQLMAVEESQLNQKDQPSSDDPWSVGW